MSTSRQTSGSELAGRTVLVVEDRYLVATDVAAEVRRMGGRVVGPCPNLAAAETLIGEEAIDIALLDVNLDGEWIYPLAERLSDAGVSIIFITGYDDALLAARWRDCPRVQKPITASVLRAELAKLA